MKARDKSALDDRADARLQKAWTFPEVAMRCEPVNWLWKHWLARGELHLLAGRSGVTKSALALNIAAILSRGGEWPPGSGSAPRCHTAILSFEDHAQHSIVPRLVYAGADLSMITVLPTVLTNHEGEAVFDPETHMGALAAKLASIPDLGLFIADPLDLGLNLHDAHNAYDVRKALAPYVSLSRDLNIATLGVKHFVKGNDYGSVVDRISGSYAFTAAARLVWIAERVRRMVDGEAQDALVLTRGKSNLGPDGGGWEYTKEIDQLSPPVPAGVEAIRIKFGEVLIGNATDLLASISDEDKRDMRKLDMAKAFLISLLRRGPLGQTLVEQEADAAGHAWRTVERAAAKLKIVKTKLKTEWAWSLVSAETTIGAGSNTAKTATSGNGILGP